MTLFVDVDGTLRLVSGPNTGLINKIQRYRQSHPFTDVVVWSRAGTRHARDFSHLLPGARVRAKNPSILRSGDIYIDNQRTPLAPRGRHYLPRQFIERPPR